MMHREAWEQWPRLLDKWPHGKANVLDVGSYNVNGCLRPLIETRGWDYLGLDQSPGPNVDVVTTNPYSFPLDDGQFDIVVSSSTMEHVEAIWLWVPELVRVLRPGGMLAIITHVQWEYHPFPVDTWRIMPDGMRFLFDLTRQLENYDIRIYCSTDIYGVAWRKQDESN
jgi:SAM-dependent methyltransferase